MIPRRKRPAAASLPRLASSWRTPLLAALRYSADVAGQQKANIGVASAHRNEYVSSQVEAAGPEQKTKYSLIDEYNKNYSGIGIFFGRLPIVPVAAVSAAGSALPANRGTACCGRAAVSANAANHSARTAASRLSARNHCSPVAESDTGINI